MEDIIRLMVFHSAVQTLSFCETARHLHISQPTASKHIQVLEQELCVQLFDRSAAKPRLTDAAQALLPWARRLVRLSCDMDKIAEAMQTKVAGQIRIACTTAAGRYILPQLAALFRQRYPQARVSILTCTQEECCIPLPGGGGSSRRGKYRGYRGGTGVPGFLYGLWCLDRAGRSSPWPLVWLLTRPRRRGQAS